MLRRAVVTEIEDGRATIRVARPQEGCAGGCATCGSCGDGGNGTRAMDLTVDALAEPVRTGDVIEVDLAMPNAALAALALFGVPLACMFAGALAARQWQGGEDGPAILGGAVGLGLGFGLIALVDRLTPALRPRATFTRLVHRAAASGARALTNGEGVPTDATTGDANSANAHPAGTPPAASGAPSGTD